MLQIEVIIRYYVGELKIMKLIVDNNIQDKFEGIYTDCKIDYKRFTDIFSESIDNIEDKEMLYLAKKILIGEYNLVKKRIKEKWQYIIEKYKRKRLTKQEKDKIKLKIEKLDIKLKKTREKIENFGLNIDDLL